MIDIRVFDTSEQLSQAAAELMALKTREAIAERGRFTLALSGGSTVARPYELYAGSEGIDWSKVYVFWGDDRFVEPENPYSNYTLGKSALMDHQPAISAQNVFPIPYKALTPTEGALAYAKTIRDLFGIGEGEWPVFDLAQNGMGPDAHTASLFPHLEAIEVDDQIVVSSHAGLPPWVDRITMTLPVFNHARCVLMIATGAGKAEILKKVLEEEPNRTEYPSSAVRPINGEIVWMLDSGIAAKLSSK